MGLVEQHLAPLLASFRNGDQPNEDMLKNVENLPSDIRYSFSDFETEYRQKKYIRDADLLVDPVEVKLSKVFRVQTDKCTGSNYQEQQKESFQYISLRKVITRILR